MTINIANDDNNCWVVLCRLYIIDNHITTYVIIVIVIYILL